MKKLLSPVIALALAGMARADLTITQQVEKAGDTQTMTMKIKDQQIRMDVNAAATTIIDLKTGDATTFVHPQKLIVKVPGAKLKELASQLKAQNGGDAKVEAPKATGKKETINGYVCDEYEINANGGKMSVWMTKDIPAAEKAMAQLAEVGGSADPVQNALKSQQITGFPMRTVLDTPSTGKTTVTVVGLKEDPIPASEFTPPEGYKEMKLPAGMPGGMGGQ